MKRTITLSALLGLATVLSAQNKEHMGYGAAMMQEASKLVGQERSDDALVELATVHRSDSLYERVLMQRVQIHLDQDAYGTVEELCRRGIAERGNLNGAFTMIRAAVLVDMERFADALAACDSAIAVYPGSFRPYHLRALALAGIKDKKAALEQAMKNVRRFPYQRDAHIMMGTIAQSEGLTAEAGLAFMMAQLVRFGDRKAEQLLSYYDGLLGSTLEPKSEGYDLSVTGDDLEDIDLLIRGKVAMDKKYKLKPDLTYPMCRQSHLMMQTIADRKGKWKGFYTTTYGPIAKAIMDDGKFEGFVYHCLSASSDRTITGMVEKNKSKVLEFRTWLGTYMQQNHLMFPETEGGPDLLHHYNDDNDLLGFGPGDARTGLSTGMWTVYHSNGRISGQGAFNDAGDRTGKWTYWDTMGNLDSEGNFQNGKVEGVILNYQPSGCLMDSTTIRSGKREGLACSYYELGGRRTCKTAKVGEWTGPTWEYFPSGPVQWSYELVNGNTEGSATQTYADGSTRFTGIFKNDERTGTFQQYHPNGTKSEEYVFAAGKSEGPFKEWHANGQLSLEGTMKAGSNIGERRRYDEWGTLRMIERFGEQGRQQGLREEFNADGSRLLDMEYNRDLLIRYTYYSSDGKTLGEGTRSKGKFQLKGYHPNGTLRVEGLYLDEGAKDGQWKYYHADGTPDSEENYVKGKINGTQKYFREDGTLARQDEVYDQDGITYRSYTRFFRSGKVREQGQMRNDEAEGVVRRFNPDGTRISVEYYVGGSRDGWQEYFDALGKMVYAERILHGAIADRVSYDDEGVEYEHIVVKPGAFEMVTHYPDGKVMARLHLMNGYLHGTANWLYPDGGPEVSGGFLNGDRHGTWTSYHPNGKKRLEEEYHLGKVRGSSKRWFLDGTPENEIQFVDGQRHGGATENHMNGKRSFLREYENGELHGRVISYSYEGVPQMVRFYFKGALVAYGSPAADGSVKDTLRLTPGVMQLETHYPSGTLSRKMTYRNGEIDGTFQEYHPNGQLMEETTHRVGEVEGTNMEYYPNGKVSEVTPYVDGYIHGERVINWDNGMVREHITYVNGERQGPWTVHDRTGKVVARYRTRNDDVVEIGK
ncbi:MAG: toxin-antitoxin system YwqK family antitoxin [Flavobacteriales bacterium]|nr:toxin-antitoxin system YwqK family antitoxin [Flavobacteriales bacterium]